MPTQSAPKIIIQDIPVEWRGAPTFRADPAASKHCPPIANEREQMQSIKKVAAVGGAPSKLRGK